MVERPARTRLRDLRKRDAKRAHDAFSLPHAILSAKRPLHGVAACLRRTGVRQGGRQLVKGRNKIRLLHHPGDGARRLSDHSQAGVSGDADVGEAKDEGYGHVDQAASSAVTSQLYRSNARAR